MNQVIPRPEAIFPEEYFNYRRHDIPLPSTQETVHLDSRLGSQKTDAQGNAVLQIGLTTHRANDQNIVPLNLCIVLDRSGSMDGARIQNTREATKALIQRLRPQDRLSVVLFDDRAEVLVASQLVTNPMQLAQEIDKAIPRGGTNLNAGFQLGYQQVADHYNQKGSNKVIFLTDALANLGVTDPTDILRQAGVYRQQYQIDFALIGVGASFNADLARVLTSGGHSIHFLSDGDDIKKVFIDELESLLSPIGREVVVELEWDASLQLRHFYGYKPTVGSQRISLPINNMNSGLTQVLLADFQLIGQKSGTVHTTLTWKDAITQQPLSLTTETIIRAGNAATPLADDSEVALNYTIAQLAESLQAAATLFYQGKEGDAARLLKNTLQQAKQQYPTAHADLRFMTDLVEGFKTNIEQYKP